MLIRARMATAKAMSVAVGIAQPCIAAESPRFQAAKTAAGDEHSAHRGDDRQRRPPDVAEVACDELALELQPGDEEEDREQAVGRPGGQGQVQVQGARPDHEVTEVVVRLRPGTVRPDDRDDGPEEQQQATGGLGAQDARDPGALQEGAT